MFLYCVEGNLRVKPSSLQRPHFDEINPNYRTTVMENTKRTKHKEGEGGFEIYKKLLSEE